MYVLKLWHSHGHDKPRLRETRQVPSHNAIMPTTIRLKRAKSCLLARWMARLPTNKGSRNPAVTKARVLSILPPAMSRSPRSEEHTSELQSRLHLVCRLLLEKKKVYNDCQRVMNV